MKRILLLAILLLLFASSSLALEQFIRYSAVTTGDALIAQGQVYFDGVTVTGDGTNAITMDIHDGTTIAGNKITPTLNFPQSSTTKTQAYGVSPGVRCNSGIYVNITTAGTLSYTVYFHR